MERISELRAILSNYLPWNKWRLDSFSRMLLALITARTVNLQRLATGFGTDTKITSRYRRLQRFFAEFNIDYTLFARLIFQWFFSESKKIYLCLDRTNWYWGKQPINALVLSIAYEGIAIPIYWSLLDKEGTSDTPERIAIMVRFIDTFGTDCIASLLADREFVGKFWFQWLIDNKIPFHIRIKENSKVVVFRGKGKTAQQLFNDVNPKQEKAYENKVLIFGCPLRIAASRSESGELLIVATNQDPKNAVPIYLRRWEIESLFEALKSRGFHFEDTHITKPERIEKLIAVLSIALCWAHKIGEWRHEKEPIRMIKFKTSTRPQYSYFRYGLDYLDDTIRQLSSKCQVYKQILLKMLLQRPLWRGE